MDEIEEELDELEVKLKRLKQEYDQYFLGILKREPFILKGEIQKAMHRYLSQPPTRVRTKFRFNTLCARYQSYRQLWGRTLRQIEEGTYRPHLFRAQLPSEAREPSPRTPQRRPKSGSSAVDQLFDALSEAREKTGEGMRGLTREKLSEIVKEQARDLRARHGSGKIRFKVVVEGNRTRLRATVVRP